MASLEGHDVETLVDVFRRNARLRADDVAYNFLHATGATASITYGQLYRAACNIAHTIQNHAQASGRAVLCYPPGLDFVKAFWACHLAEVVAVPVPVTLRPRDRALLSHLISNCTPSLVLTDSETSRRLSEQKLEFGEAKIVCTDVVPLAPSLWDVSTNPNLCTRTAVLQYTSGSTSTPKGVMISDANMIFTARSMSNATGLTKDSVGLNWVPHYHDMGLVGGIVTPMVAGFPVFLMSHFSAMSRPASWLKAISENSVTISGGPNFAFEACLRIPDADVVDINLESWTVAYNGAEPIREATLRRFQERFSSAGFSRKAIYPCYGLAESTLMVAGGPSLHGFASLSVDAGALQSGTVAEVSADGINNVTKLVSSGTVLESCEIEIVDPKARTRCPKGRIGEIWIKGPHVGLGYWNNEAATADVFKANISNEEAEYLRSGDLGFFHHDQLFVVGRIKDLIVINGQNIYPHDIEQSLESSHVAIKAETTAAFAIDIDDVERAVVVCEVEQRWKPHFKEIVSALRKRMADDHAVILHSIVFVQRGTLPKTTSGKIRRAATRQEFQSGELSAIHLWRLEKDETLRSTESSTDHHDTDDDLALVSALIQEILHPEAVRQQPLDLQISLVHLGLDSIEIMRLSNRIGELFNVSVPPDTLFSAKSVVDLARKIRELRSNDDLTVRNADPKYAAGLPRPVPVSRDGEIALSFSQNRLWVLEQLEALGPAYNIAAAVRMDGILDMIALERAFAELVRRHEILRTRFVTRDDQVFQAIDEAAPFRLALMDLSDLDPAQRADAIRRAEQDEAAHRFDLAQGPLIRATLLRLSAQEHIILVTMHHIVSDGWSMSIVIREIGALYAAFMEGRPSPLAGLPVQYADFAVWQRRWLQGEVLDKQVAYWKARLAGAPPALDLPTDRARPLTQSYRGASCTFELPKELTGALAALARQEGATLFMVLLAAFKVVLSRWSGQEDIVVGTPVAGRTHAETEDLIGFFINMLALRTSLAGNPDFRTLLRQVRDGALEAYAHQEMPFERLVEEVRPVRDLSRQPIFQTLVVLQNMPQERLELPGLTLRRVTEQRATAKFDLSLYLQETEHGLAGTLEYATDLFEQDTIERLKDHYRLLLEGVVADPEQPISLLPMLTGVEQHLLLEAWNDTAADFPRDKLLHELFADQAALTPDAVAVIHDQQQLTYRELDRRSNRLAHHLQSLGVGPEIIVGLCVERSPEMIVAMLAILKAGGAYLPLDPAYPSNRLAYMLRDAAARVIVTRTASHPSLPDQTAHIVDLDAHHHVIEACPDTPPASGADPASLAYVIYTSGSTGHPKGVMIVHEGVVNYITTLNRRYSVSSSDRVLQSSSISFDPSVRDIWCPLVAGAKLIVPHGLDQADRASSFGFVSSVGISLVLSVTPSVLNAPLSDEATEPLPELRALLTCGEALSYETCRLTRSRMGYHFPIVNQYGPTECTMSSTFFVVGDEPAVGIVPIGRPIANRKVYVLDRHMCPVPIGSTGEIYIGGVGLARGYLNRPDLTAERFVPNPFGSGGRLYRTGDLGRWRKDGNLEFLGRADHQVKIRGFRIELGEIEAVLLSHPEVRQAVVVAHQDESGDKRLVAYVAGEASPRDLRAHTLNTLPDYMVPTAFVPLETMPLTPNGKIDRAALPHPDRDDGLARAEYVAPRTPTEEILANIWADVLQVSQVGVNDNFFELGGNSLLAMRMVSRVRNIFNIELPLRTLFEDPRVVELGHRIEIVQREERGVTAPRPVPVSRDGEIALSFSQNRLWVLEQLEALGPAYNIAAAVRMDGILDMIALERAFAELVRRHEILRTRFVTRDDQVFQAIDEAAPFRLALMDLSDLDPAQRADAIRRAEQDEAAHRFDLAQGPLIRATLLRLSAQEHIILVTMHHIVSDGWSMSIVIREIGALYAAFMEGRPSPLAGLPVQYADFAVWQRRWLQGEVLDKQVAYWKARLAGAPPALDLPTDRARPLTQSYRGASCTFELPKELTGALAALARQEGATLFMVLLAAFKVVLSRWSGQEDIVVGTPVAGRTHAETEDLIGFFINMLALRTSLAGNPDFRTLLRQVRDGALEAYAHQEMPFERLVEEVRPVRDLSRQPIFQTLVVLQNMPQERLELPGLTLRRVTEQRATAKFDLSLYLQETEHGLAGTLEYATDLFEQDTIERLKDHYRLLLEGVVADPEQPISLLPMLTGVEQHLLLEAWNDTAADFPRDKLLHELFADQAALTPDAVAVIHDQQQLTYRELDRRSNRLAHHLQSLGVGPEIIVGLCVERSPEMIVAMLAILKAGGAYLPLDPAYPSNRLAYMLRDAAARVIVTRTASHPSLPDQTAHIVDLDAHHHVIEACPDTPPASGADPASLAYVIYTSGSTGHPKGVGASHLSMVNRIFAQRTFDPIMPVDVCAQKTAINFVDSIFEMIGPLVYGSILVIISRMSTTDASALAELIFQRAISRLILVPILLEQLLLVPDAREKLCSLRRITVSGEMFDRALLRRAFESLPRIRITNLYGSSEVAGDATAFVISDRNESVLIGRPLSNTQVYVLDRHMCPVPIGSTGEIYIGGVGLARGYLNRPDLTAERFVPNPFGSGGRLYRTGDLGRWRKDGNLEFLGRADHQVKIRGFRIELGEIEAVLLSHPEVRQAVVVAHQDESGDKRLVAYVAGEASPRDLRAHTLNTLPDYMVPTAFVPLETMPLTPNGKIDRAALPHPDRDDGLARAEYVAPRTPTEEILANIWADVLQVSQVGVNDNFFELGGNSLLAMRMVSRVRNIFNIELPLRTLFEDPNVYQLSSILEEKRPDRTEEIARTQKMILSMTDDEVQMMLEQLKKDRSHG